MDLFHKASVFRGGAMKGPEWSQVYPDNFFIEKKKIELSFRFPKIFQGIRAQLEGERGSMQESYFF